MVKCCIRGCTTNAKSTTTMGISLHRFPTNLAERDMWNQALQNGRHTYKNSSKVCSLHFEPNDVLLQFGRRILKPFSIPKLNMDEMHLTDCQSSSLQPETVSSATSTVPYEFGGAIGELDLYDNSDCSRDCNISRDSSTTGYKPSDIAISDNRDCKRSYTNCSDAQKPNFEKCQKISLNDAVGIHSFLSVTLEESDSDPCVSSKEYFVQDFESPTKPTTLKVMKSCKERQLCGSKVKQINSIDTTSDDESYDNVDPLTINDPVAKLKDLGLATNMQFKNMNLTSAKQELRKYKSVIRSQCGLLKILNSKHLRRSRRIADLECLLKTIEKKFGSS